MIWTEEMIREEMRRLDAKTGLVGSRVPIHMTESNKTLGSFKSTSDGKPVRFTFSRTFLDDPEFSRAQAIDLIRHEYAHYMNAMRKGARGHGESWKQCCREIGAMPERCYNRVLNEVQRRREKAAEKVCGYMKLLEPGMRLQHPSFGEGVLQAVTASEEGTRLTIRFAGGTKVLGARWVLAYCRLIREKGAV